MPKPDYKRVRLESGAKVTVATVTDGMTVVDEPAVDRNGSPLVPTYPEQGGEPTRTPYAEWTNAQLTGEIEARNDAAGDAEPQIEVAASAKKVDLVAALEADDARRATPTPA